MKYIRNSHEKLKCDFTCNSLEICMNFARSSCEVHPNFVCSSYEVSVKLWLWHFTWNSYEMSLQVHRTLPGWSVIHVDSRVVALCLHVKKIVLKKRYHLYVCFQMCCEVVTRMSSELTLTRWAAKFAMVPNSASVRGPCVTMGLSLLSMAMDDGMIQKWYRTTSHRTGFKHPREDFIWKCRTSIRKSKDFFCSHQFSIKMYS